MRPFILLACPACALGNPTFFVLSMFLGTVPVAYLLLRPFTRTIRTWGLPRLDAGRTGSLLLLLVWLVPLWAIGRQHHPVERVAVCIGGLFLCLTYLWLRACWLLEAHAVCSRTKELLFPGILSPAIALLGTTVGSWVLGVLFIAPAFPSFLAPQTIFSIVIGVPIWMLVFAGVDYTFRDSPAIPPPYLAGGQGTTSLQ